MEIKAFMATLGLGMLAGAAVTLMLPKDSQILQTAENAATTVKDGISQALESNM